MNDEALAVLGLNGVEVAEVAAAASVCADLGVGSPSQILSLRLVAASGFSLTDSERAVREFATLAGEGAPIGHPLLPVAGVLGRVHVDDTGSGSATGRAFALLDSERFTGAFVDDDQFGVEAAAEPVGRTGVPFYIWRAAIGRGARGAQTFVPGLPFDQAGALATVLRFAARGTRAAMQDAYHWRYLATPVLPVEPEILALALSALGHRPTVGVPFDAGLDEGVRSLLRDDTVALVPWLVANDFRSPPDGVGGVEPTLAPMSSG